MAPPTDRSPAFTQDFSNNQLGSEMTPSRNYARAVLSDGRAVYHVAGCGWIFKKSGVRFLNYAAHDELSRAFDEEKRRGKDRGMHGFCAQCVIRNEAQRA